MPLAGRVNPLIVAIAPELALLAVASDAAARSSSATSTPVQRGRDGRVRAAAAWIEQDRDRLARGAVERPVVDGAGGSERARRRRVQGDRAARRDRDDRPPHDRAAHLFAADVEVQVVQVERRAGGHDQLVGVDRFGLPAGRVGRWSTSSTYVLVVRLIVS